MRILIAGVLGGIAMFVWASLAHLVLPLGTMGISTLPNEPAAVQALHAAVGEKSGLFLFPSTDAKGGPSGFLAYSAGNVMAMTPSTLGEEVALEVIQSLIAAGLVAMAAVTAYWRRVGFVALVGVAASLCTSGSYWVWYRFPTDYTLGYMFTDILRYVAAGLVIAALVRPRAAATA